MRQEDQLRNTLREYYDTQETPFNEQDWKQARAYLAAARRKRKIRQSAIIIATLLSALFISQFNFQKLRDDDNKHMASPPPNRKVSPVPTSQSALPSPIIARQKTRKDKNPNKGSRHSAYVMNVAKADAALFPDKIPQSLNLNGTTKEPDVSRPEEIPVNDNNSIDVLQPNVNEALTNTTEDGITLEKKGDIALPGAEPQVHDQNRELQKEIPQIPADLALQTTTAAALASNSKEFTSQEERAHIMLMDSSHYSPPVGTITKEIAVGDTLPKPISPDQPAGEGIFYEAGAAWFYGWKNPVKRDARGFSPATGINYMNRLGNRCAFSFGIQYLQVPKLSNSSKTSRISTYRYGELSRVTVITPSTIHYLLAPLRFNYYMDHSNSFGAGFNVAYLLNVDARVTSYDEKPGYNGNYETVKLSGYTQGFSWFDSQLAFCYRRAIGSSVGLQAEVFVGLTDVKQDDFFGLRNKERNSGAKLSLVYYAFKKINKR